MVKLLHLTVWSFFVFGLSIAKAGSPLFVTEKYLTVLRGETVHASCNGGGDIVYWLKPGGGRVPENALHKNIFSITERDQLLLTIMNADSTNAGEYMCRGTRNGEEDILVRLVLEVSDIGPPVFEDPFEEVETYSGRNLALRCKATGEEQISYTWLDQHSSAISDLTPNAFITMEENYSILNLISVTDKNNGVYTCTAENHLGKESKLFKVMVNNSITEDGVVKITVINVTDTSIQLSLTSNSEEDIFLFRMKLADESEYTITIGGIDTKPYMVSDLLPGGKYVLQATTLTFVRGNQTLGIWSDEISVSLPPGAPEIIVHQAADRKFSLEIFRPFYYVSYDTVERYIIKYRTIQQQSGTRWLYTGCEYTTIVPSCGGSGYEISNLQTNAYYSITIQSEGPGGKSKVSEMKIFSP